MKIKNLPGQSNKNPQGQKWRRLDNTGKLFPLVSSESLSNVFRIAVTLKEESSDSGSQLLQLCVLGQETYSEPLFSYL